MSQRNLYLIRTVLFFVNFIVILFMSMIIYKTTELICDNYMARDFLEKIKYIPTTPWKVPVFSLLLLMALILSVIVREKLFYDMKPILYMLCILDILICIAIMYYLNMSYKGVILLALANIIMHIEGNRNRYFFVILSIIVYILFDYDIFSIRFTMFSIKVP